jgi:hypothetical protein
MQSVFGLAWAGVLTAVCVLLGVICLLGMNGDWAAREQNGKFNNPVCPCGIAHRKRVET